MITVEFNYKTIITNILCSEKDKMSDVCQKFLTKTEITTNNLIYLYGDQIINLTLPISSFISNLDRERKVISIIVNESSSDDQNNKHLIKSTVPICPKCYENIKLSINDYKINLFGCKNGHSFDMLINEYEKTQNIDLNKIVCTECKAKKLDTYENKMYICNKCKKILCPKCLSKHDKTHNVLNYDLKNATCEKHDELFFHIINIVRKIFV